MRFVTSFGPDGAKLYGEKFVRSFLEFVGGEELVVYHEGKKLPIINERLKWRDLFEDVPGCKEFLLAIAQLPVFRGLIHNPQDGQRVRNYRYDLFTFARKVWAVLDASSDYNGRVIWLDADIEFFRDVPDEVWDKCFDGKPMFYMPRLDWHPCASCIGWDMSSEAANQYMATLHRLYYTGEVLLLPEWHDSFVFDAVRSATGIEAAALGTPEDWGNGPVNVFDKNFGHYATHAKGAKKFGPARYRQLHDIVLQMQPERILEVGTWNGDRAIEMHSLSPESEYIGFDLFEYATAETDEVEKNVKPHHKLDDVVRKLSNASVKADLFPGDTKVTLPAYLEKYGKKSADLIFIDGGHSVETIASDLEYALEALSDGGIIVLDDWYEDMPEEALDKWGCNRPLERSGLSYRVLPIADRVKGGGVTKMVVVQP